MLAGFAALSVETKKNIFYTIFITKNFEAETICSSSTWFFWISSVKSSWVLLGFAFSV